MVEKNQPSDEVYGNGKRNGLTWSKLWNNFEPYY